MRIPTLRSLSQRFVAPTTISRAMSSTTTTTTTPTPPPSSTATSTPIQDAIYAKLTSLLHPVSIKIQNDSHLHAHHAAMAGATSKETHFRVTITSDAFEGKRLPQRHRMVYKALEEELKREGGVHALQIKASTPGEDRKKKDAGVE